MTRGTWRLSYFTPPGFVIQFINILTYDPFLLRVECLGKTYEIRTFCLLLVAYFTRVLLSIPVVVTDPIGTLSLYFTLMFQYPHTQFLTASYCVSSLH